MTNGRLFAVGAGGILLLVLVGMGAAMLIGSAPTPVAAPPPEGDLLARPPTVPQASAALAPMAPEAAAPTTSPELEAAVSPIRRRPSAEAGTAWDQVPIAARPYDLGPELARPVTTALEAARGDMEPCFKEEERALARGEGPRFDPTDPPTGPAVLVLRLESREGFLDVVDTELDYAGTSTRALPACCQRILKGWPIAAPLATPGRRYRLKYLLD